MRLTYGMVIALVTGLLVVQTGCGGPARSERRTVSGLPDRLSGGQQGIALSLDPTEVGLIRLQDSVDSLVTLSREQYRIGINDKLDISIYARSFSQDTEAEELAVRDDGKIYLKLLGEMQAAGLTVNELRQKITSEAGPFVKDPFVLVSIKEYNSQRVTLIGEIGGGSGTGGRAVTVPLEGPTRLIDVLSTTILTSGQQAGNVSASPRIEADLSNIIITRRTGERYRVNLNTYLFGNNPSANLQIFNGDLIFIPHQNDNRVFVLGEVSSPGVVPIGLGLTVTEAIARSGGFTNIARRNDVKLVRGGLDDPDMIAIPVQDVARKGRRSQDVPLRNGDILFIPRSPLGDINILLAQILPPLQTYLLLQTLVK